MKNLTRQLMLRNFKRQAIGCGVVLGGHTAINVLMVLGKNKRNVRKRKRRFIRRNQNLRNSETTDWLNLLS